MEKLKTALLVLLVATSLVLTYLLWYEEPDYEEAAVAGQEPFIFEEPRSREEALNPYRILLPGEEKEYQALLPEMEGYSPLWEAAKDHLLTGKDREGLQRTSPPEGDPGLKLYFDPPWPLEGEESEGDVTILQANKWEWYWEEEAENENENESEEEGEDQDENDEDEDEEEEKRGSWVVTATMEGQEEEMFYRIPSREIDEELLRLIETAKEHSRLYQYLEEDQLIEEEEILVAEAPARLFLPGGEIEMPLLEIKKEEIATDELLQAIFLDPNLVRKVEEREEKIYTDGERGLTVADGTFQYSFPRLEEGEVSLSYFQALEQAVEFLCNYGGWPSQLRLDTINFVEHDPLIRRQDSYYARWQLYHRGLPLVGARGGVQMTFNDQGLIEYHRYLGMLQEQEGKITMAPPLKALEKAADWMREEGVPEEEGPALRAMYPAYYVPEVWEGQKIHPVWVCEFEQQQIIMRGDNLEFLYQGEDDYGLLQS